MSQFKSVLKTLLIVFAASALVFSALIPFLIKSELLEKALIRRTEEVAHGAFIFDHLTPSFWPRLQITVHDAMLLSAAEKGFQFKAKEIKIHLNLLAALMKRLDIESLEIKEGEFEIPLSDSFLLEKLVIRPVALKVRSVRHGEPMQVSVSGGLEGTARTLEGKFLLTLEHFEKWDWDQAALQGRLTLRPFELNGLKKRMKSRDSAIQEGSLSSTLEVSKAKGEADLAVEGRFDLAGLVYEMRDEGNAAKSPSLDTGFAFKAKFNLEKESFVLDESVWITPVGRAEIKANGSFGAWEIQDMRLTATNLLLEAIPQYALSLKSFIPSNVGFSGVSDLELFVKGTPDHLSLHGNWDLTPTLLTYGRFFSKPKDVPIQLIFDYLVKDQKILSGDFSTRFQDLSVKGSFSNWDFVKDEGQVNLITNKFSLEGWEAFLPLIQPCRLHGEMKILANFKGSPAEARKAETMLNITLEDAEMVNDKGKGIRRVHLAFDYGPVMLQAKQVELTLDDAALTGEFSIRQILSHPEAKWAWKSPSLEPAAFLEALQQHAGRWFSKETNETLGRSKMLFRKIFPVAEPFENISAEGEWKAGRLHIQNLDFEAYSGAVHAEASLNSSEGIPAYWVEGEATRLSLARFFPKGEDGKSWVEGNLFLKGHLEGAGFEWSGGGSSLSGRGTISMTNGEFPGFDLLASVGGIEGFSGLNAFLTQKTSFDDLRFDYEIAKDKIMATQLNVSSADLTAQGNGDISWDGHLNHRLDVFLSPALTDKVMAPLLGRKSVEGNQQFGPVPLLLSGPIAKPEIKPDPNHLPRLLDDLRNKQTQRVLRNFLPEEALFKRRGP